MAKRKPLSITIEIPEEKILKHISYAYGLVCHYRTKQNLPIESLETWLLRVVIEGSNAMINFDNNARAEAEKKKNNEVENDK